MRGTRAKPSRISHFLRKQMKAAKNVTYRFHIKGRLNEEWSTWFDDMTISYADGETVISGPIADQAALHGVLAKIRDLGLSLIDVHRIGEETDQIS
jgi:hypothetical protein